jgi:hypothetical protein
MNAAVFCYAWDFADEGVDKLLSWCQDTGITHLFLAATYHTGWFLHSHNPKHKAYMAESGAAYFHPQNELYGRLKPPVARMCQEHDYFREITEKASAYGVTIMAWTIGTHNTRLGSQNPDCCVTNCFGDVYPHALCPLHPDVWQYLLALCKDIGSNFSVASLTLESFDYGGWKHDHQHERDFHALNAVEKGLMNLCFNPATMAAVAETGVDAEAVRVGVRDLLQAAFDTIPERPEGHPINWEQAEARIEGLAGYRACVSGVGKKVREAVTVAMAPATCRNTIHSTLGAYGKDAVYIRENLPAAVEKAGELPVWITSRLGAEDFSNQQALTDFVNAAREGNADGIAFYNYSESPRRLLQWLGPALGKN